MMKARFPHWRPRVFVPMLIALLVAGCQGRLAQQDEYFAPFSGVVTALKAETQRLVTYHEALQALRRPCTTNVSTAASRDAVTLHRPIHGVTSVGEAGRQSCVPNARTTAAYGSASSAYKRWVEDRVHPLPDPSDTASSITGGS